MNITILSGDSVALDYFLRSGTSLGSSTGSDGSAQPSKNAQYRCHSWWCRGGVSWIPCVGIGLHIPTETQSARSSQ
jgi:hypothetical protein